MITDLYKCTPFKLYSRKQTDNAMTINEKRRKKQ